MTIHTNFLGVLDEGYSYDLSVEDAKELGMKSIYHATYRDAASGGYVNRKYTQIIKIMTSSLAGLSPADRLKIFLQSIT